MCKHADFAREHLKRKHYPVQCDRCYEIFPGSDRAKSVMVLEAHRQLATPCERKEAILKEGISDSQWAKLEKKQNSKQSRGVSRVEKWWEMWDILFPGVPRPKTPCKEAIYPPKNSMLTPTGYDIESNGTNAPPTTLECQRFGDIFSGMLDRQVLDRRILFPEEQEQEMKARVSVLAQTAFSIYSRIQPIVSSYSNSNSSRGHPATSLFSGPCTNSTPATTEDIFIMPSRQAQTGRSDVTDMSSLARTMHPMTMSNVMGPPAMPYRPSTAEAPGLVSAQLAFTDYQPSQSPNSYSFGVHEPGPAWSEPVLFPDWGNLAVEAPVRSETNHTSLPSIHETLMSNRQS